MSETRGPYEDASKSSSDHTKQVASGSHVQHTEGQGSSSTPSVSEHEHSLADEKQAAVASETEKGTHPALSSVDEKQWSGSSEKDSVAAASDEKNGVTTSDQDADAAAAAAEDGTAHLNGWPRIILVFGLCATTFIIGLDQMIIATAIPKITTLFGSLDE